MSPFLTYTSTYTVTKKHFHKKHTHASEKLLLACSHFVFRPNFVGNLGSNSASICVILNGSCHLLSKSALNVTNLSLGQTSCALGIFKLSYGDIPPSE
ncbi:hypothetical protein CW304_12130 [Bacillus sp. UFRGS-B20]|nr:hypothetical protein CW304_12130 [Bacillus sp. UFRGS-B20]